MPSKDEKQSDRSPTTSETSSTSESTTKLSRLGQLRQLRSLARTQVNFLWTSDLIEVPPEWVGNEKKFRRWLIKKQFRHLNSLPTEQRTQLIDYLSSEPESKGHGLILPQHLQK